MLSQTNHKPRKVRKVLLQNDKLLIFVHKQKNKMSATSCVILGSLGLLLMIGSTFAYGFFDVGTSNFIMMVTFALMCMSSSGTMTFLEHRKQYKLKSKSIINYEFNIKTNSYLLFAKFYGEKMRFNISKEVMNDEV
jgi:hypothetical protein